MLLLAALAAGLIGFEQNSVVATYNPATTQVQQVVLGSQPALSPDGTRLAYVKDEHVYVANADGTGARVVTAGQWPAWSPDGTRLAVVDWDGLTTQFSPRGDQQLYIVDIGTGARTQLTFGSGHDSFLPSWSPDGTQIAYGTIPQEALYVIPASGGTPQLVATGNVTAAGGPAWSPDGQTLAFLSNNANVFTVAPDGTGLRQVSYVISISNSLAQRPAWSGDGSQIVWSAGGTLCVTDLLGNAHALASGLQGSLPTWAPGGDAPPTGGTCDSNADVRVDLTDDGPQPADTTLTAPGTLFFVNRTNHTVTVRTTMHGESAAIEPGAYWGFSTIVGTFGFTEDGHSGVFQATSPTRLTLGARNGTLSGRAAGVVPARLELVGERNGATPFHVASVQPDRSGAFRLVVHPPVTTRYRVVSAFGASAWAAVPVSLVPRVFGRSVTLTLIPHRAGVVVRLGRQTARTTAAGVVRFTGLRPGRYAAVAGRLMRTFAIRR